MIYKIFYVIFIYMISVQSLSINYFSKKLPVKQFHKQLSFIPTQNKFINFHKNHYSTPVKMTNSDKVEELTVFHKIVSGELPCKKVYEDDLVLAFYDIEPAAPSHILLVPKELDGLASLSDATERHQKVLGHMLVKAAQIARDNNLGDFRLVVNSGPRALQTVFYLHMHLMSGRNFTWPPG